MTLGFEDRTGDTHGQMEMRFHGRLPRRLQRAVWLNHNGQQCRLRRGGTGWVPGQCLIRLRQLLNGWNGIRPRPQTENVL